MSKDDWMDAFGGGLVAGQEPDDPDTRFVIALQRAGLSNAEAAAAARVHFAGRSQGLGAGIRTRWPKNAVQITPVRVVGPDPKEFPFMSERKRVANITPPDEDPTTFMVTMEFDAHATIYGISGFARGKWDGGDAYSYDNDHYKVRFTRITTGDRLSTNLCFAPAIIGSAERPTPIATPGWYFEQGNYIQIEGDCLGATDWEIDICFHCIDFVKASNLGISREQLVQIGAEQ